MVWEVVETTSQREGRVTPFLKRLNKNQKHSIKTNFWSLFLTPLLPNLYHYLMIIFQNKSISQISEKLLTSMEVPKSFNM